MIGIVLVLHTVVRHPWLAIAEHLDWLMPVLKVGVIVHYSVGISRANMSFMLLLRALSPPVLILLFLFILADPVLDHI